MLIRQKCRLKLKVLIFNFKIKRLLRKWNVNFLIWYFRSKTYILYLHFLFQKLNLCLIILYWIKYNFRHIFKFSYMHISGKNILYYQKFCISAYSLRLLWCSFPTIYLITKFKHFFPLNIILDIKWKSCKIR